MDKLGQVANDEIHIEEQKSGSQRDSYINEKIEPESWFKI